MSSFMLLIWISLIVILNVRGDSSINDPTINCQHCQANTLPVCSATESETHNFTINCEELQLAPCILAVVGFDESVYMCILNKQNDAIQNTNELNELSEMMETSQPEQSVTTAVLNEDASVEEVKNEKSITEDGSNAMEEPLVTTMYTIIAQEITTVKIEQDELKTESRSTTDIEEMPQGDQPAPNTETNNVGLTEIDDNKIDSATPGGDILLEAPKTESTDVEAREITVEPKMKLMTCFDCVSTGEPACVVKPAKKKTCEAMESEKDGCYTLLQGDKKTTTRGCISDLTAEGLSYCTANKTMCIFCHEADCNNLLPSKGSSVAIGKLGLIMLGVFVCSIHI